jgi:hypothetical protein
MRVLRSLVWPSLPSELKSTFAEHAFELGLVRLLDLFEGDVDLLADVGLVALGVEAVEIATSREQEALAGEAALTRASSPLYSRIRLAVVFDDVADMYFRNSITRM